MSASKKRIVASSPSSPPGTRVPVDEGSRLAVERDAEQRKVAKQKADDVAAIAAERRRQADAANVNEYLFHASFGINMCLPTLYDDVFYA